LKLSRLKVQVPAPLEPLLYPARYKGAHGGRGGAKSHFFAEQLVVRSLSQQTRWACIREVQNSLKESVHQLLSDKIQKFGLGGAFEVHDKPSMVWMGHDAYMQFYDALDSMYRFQDDRLANSGFDNLKYMS
jgi:hypothetical protein